MMMITKKFRGKGKILQQQQPLSNRKKTNKASNAALNYYFRQ
jgi:hypothetical protein